MDFGLPEQTRLQLSQCLAEFSDIEWVKIFESRAIGTFNPGGDVDLAFAGSVDHTRALSSALAELSTPYLFDVTYYNTLQNENLRHHIDQFGISLF